MWVLEESRKGGKWVSLFVNLFIALLWRFGGLSSLYVLSDQFYSNPIWEPVEVV